MVWLRGMRSVTDARDRIVSSKGGSDYNEADKSNHHENSASTDPR